jgi:hypothetical protein
MGRPSTEQLVTMALAALEESAARCRHEPQEQTRGLAVALAYLAYVSSAPDRSPFDEFWRALRSECRVSRGTYASSALEGIYRAVGRIREREVVTAFQQAAHERYGPPPGYPNR